ncbi:MAG: helix-turn-helix transcriptional regulator [Bacteroidaceae bacterium]|nr:helix-turn-helix transcriptional regulator [Bacteroidaceae bacterium]
MKEKKNVRPLVMDDKLQREQFNTLLRYNMQRIESEELANSHDDEAFAAVASAFVRTMRKSLNINQAKLSKSIGAAPNYISRVESGAVQPSVGRFLAILYQMGFDFVPELRKDTGVDITMERNGYSFNVIPPEE